MNEIQKCKYIYIYIYMGELYCNIHIMLYRIFSASPSSLTSYKFFHLNNWKCNRDNYRKFKL